MGVSEVIHSPVDVDHVSTAPIPEACKEQATFRDYSTENERYDIVCATYTEKNSKQTVEVNKALREKHLAWTRPRMSVWDVFQLLSDIDDGSDPDTELPQVEHAFQTAEALRALYPDEDWLHLTGLIHDLGKVLKDPTFGEEPDWATVGDTYPVGCAFSPSIPFATAFVSNPDAAHPVYGTRLGMYEEHCGLMNVVMAWGHDEYFYEVLRKNPNKLPEEAYYIIKFHSFYAWHHAGDYDHLCNDTDRAMLPHVQRFQKCDLYSKAPDSKPMEELKAYYRGLIDKYLPGDLHW
jgi:inositol oxygenase